MSFGKSKVERFPSYSNSSAPAASEKKKDANPFRMHSSLLCSLSTSSSPPTGSHITPPKNLHRGGISNQFSSLDKKRRVGHLSCIRSQLSKTVCELKNKRSPMFKATNKRTPTPKGKLLKAVQARGILAFAKAADMNTNGNKAKPWNQKHVKTACIPNKVFSTPPSSPPKDTVLKLNNETKSVIEALPDGGSKVTEVTVLEIHHHSPSKNAAVKSLELLDSVGSQNPIVDLLITEPEIETVTTSGRKPRLRRNSRSAPSSPILPSDTQRHIPTPMPRRNYYDEDLPRRNSSPSGIVTSGWDANYNYMQDSALQRSLIVNSSDSSFAPIASSVLSSDDLYPPPPSQTSIPTRDTIRRTSVGEEISGSMRQEVILAFQDLRENINQLNSSFREVQTLRIGTTPRGRGPRPRVSLETLAPTPTSPQIENRDIRCNDFVCVPWYRRAFGVIFGRKMQRQSKTVQTVKHLSGLNYFSCGGRNSVNQRRNSENSDMQSRPLLQHWVLDNFLHRDYVRLWRHMRRDGRRTVRRMKRFVGPTTTDFIKDPQFWMPAVEFVLGQLLEITLRW